MSSRVAVLETGRMLRSPPAIQRFLQDLAKNTKLVRYVSVEISTAENHKEEFVAMIGRITNFYHFDLIGHPSCKLPLHDVIVVSKSHDSLVKHTVAFLDNELFEERERSRQESIALVRELIDSLERLLVEDYEVDIHVDERRLVADLIADSDVAHLIAAAESRLMKSTIPVVNFRKVLDAQKAEEGSLFSVLSECQIEFAEFIRSSKCSCKDAIEALISDFSEDGSHTYLERINEVTTLIAASQQTEEFINRRKIFLMLTRYVFDEVYTKNPWLNNPCKNVMMLLKDMTIAQIDGAREFFSPDLDETKPARELRKDPHYAKAIYELEAMQWATSPLDVLEAVHRSLVAIERAGGQYCTESEKMFSFEVSFSLFMTVTLASDIPEYLNLANFAREFFVDLVAPPDAQFALAIFTACASYLQELIASV